MEAGQEVCVQCTAPVPDYKVALIANYNETQAAMAVDFDNRQKWMALPYCDRCFHEPTQKGHFFPRAMIAHALGKAGSANLGM